MSKVISDKLPTAEDVKQTKQIIQYLKSQPGIYPTEQEELQRKNALSALHTIIEQWLSHEQLSSSSSTHNNNTPTTITPIPFRIETFGSYALNVYHSSSDIDALLLVPHFIKKQSFFNGLYRMLQLDANVTELISVSDAFVPVLKFHLLNIPIDLLFCSLPFDQVSEKFDVMEDSILFSLDSESQRAINGPRVAHQMMRLVPHFDHFKTTLQCVKLIARRRGFYGSVMGYLGGVSLAVLVGMVCQCYPNALPNVLLHRFFKMYASWNWGYKAPIAMTSSLNSSSSSTADAAAIHNPNLFGFSVWNPQFNFRDRSVLMPILTPAYPPTNCTFNMTRTTFDVIKMELARGETVSLAALFGKQPWDSLFEESDFFVRYSNYLEIEVSADNETDHRIWSAFFESRFRFLILKLEQASPSLIMHPFPEEFKVPDYDHYDGIRKHTSLYYIGLNYIRQHRRSLGGSSSSYHSHNNSISSGGSGGFEVDLTVQAQEFEEQISEWVGRLETMHRPIIRPIKRVDIPEFVYPSSKRDLLLNEKKKLKKRKSAGSEELSFMSDDVSDERPMKKVRNNTNQITRDKYQYTNIPASNNHRFNNNFTQ